MTAVAAYPKVYRCINTHCEMYESEYLYGKEDGWKCPKCKSGGTYVKDILASTVKEYRCGLCARTIIMGYKDWPAQLYKWGWIQLSTIDKFKHICVGCQDKLRKAFPLLSANMESESILESATESLPTIVQPSQMGEVEEETADDLTGYEAYYD